MRIEQRTKAVGEGHGADAGGRTRPGAAPAQALLHCAEEHVQRQGLNSRIVLQEVAQAFGHRQHPLAHRQTRDDVIGEMGGRFNHAPGVAGRTHATALARVGDEEVVAARCAPGTGKTVGKDSRGPASAGTDGEASAAQPPAHPRSRYHYVLQRRPR